MLKQVKPIKIIDFIFLGDTHGFIDDYKKQEELINSIKPEIVLSEYLQDLELNSNQRYKEIITSKQISEMVSFGEVEKLIRLCFKNKIKLIGMDLRDFGFNGNLQHKIKNHSQLSKEEEKEIDELVKKREIYQVNKIKSFLGKSSKPILVILGSWHLRKNSPLIKSFTNSKMIYPCDKNNDLLVHPPEKSNKIFYSEKILN